MLYLDHNATTPLRPEVREVMTRALGGVWGNPSSVHSEGRKARHAVEEARAEVASLLGALPEEIIFVSGGTEGDNLAIRGLAREARQRRGPGTWRVLSSHLEHPAVIGALGELERDGFAVDHVATDAQGRITPEAVAAAGGGTTVLVSLAYANHELGNLYNAHALAQAAHKLGAWFHTDAVQAVGRVAVDVRGDEVDAATVTAHKLGGPKGVGAVYLRRGLTLAPVVAGGHQERERRGGTENVVGIMGFGEAARLAQAETAAQRVALGRLRDRLQGHLLAIPGARLQGDPAARVPGTLNVTFEGARGDLVVIALDLRGICVSTGAACTSGSIEPSSVLLGLGLPPSRAREAVRFSLGPELTTEAVDHVAFAVAEVVARVRASEPRESR